AVRAVTADGVAGADLKALVGTSRRRELDAAVRRLDPDDFTAAVDLHARQATRPRIECALELRLREHVRLRPARDAHLLATDQQQRVAGRVLPLVDVGGLGETWQLVAESGSLENSRDLVVEVHGARQRIRHRLLLEHADLPALLAEQDGEYLPDGAV